MSKILLSRAIPADAGALIDANQRSALYHSPWVKPFTDNDGFDAWYGKTLTGPNTGYVLRDLDAGMIVGVVNLTEIVWGGGVSQCISQLLRHDGLVTQRLDDGGC